MPVVPLGPTQWCHSAWDHTQHTGSNQKKVRPCSACRLWDVFGLDPCPGGSAPCQSRAPTARKSGAAIPHWCTAGISARANPDCFVIMLSSNPISISGHSINRIKIELKVIIQLACPQGTRPGCSDPEPCCLQEAPKLSPRRAFGVARGADRAAHILHRCREARAALLSPSHPFHGPCAL